MKFVTHDGLLYFWTKVKNYVDSKVENGSSTSGGNADTVDGYHVTLNTSNGLKPIQFSDTDITAGLSTLPCGHIYLFYE